MSIFLNIDGKQVKAKAGMTVLQAAKKEGIYIPTLCDHPFLEPAGSCRMCIVEIEGMRGFPTACTTPVIDGLVVKTDTPQLKSLRRNILKLTLSEHPYTCLVCDKRDQCDDYQGTIRKVGVTTGCQYCSKNGSCELQQLVEYLNLDDIEFPITYRRLAVEQDDPFFDRDYNLCILCGRCVRVCNDVRNNGTLTFINRGDRTIVGTAFNKSHLETGCEFCGACVDVCPTGALSDKRSKWEGIEDKSVSSLCPYCSVGCSLNYHLKSGELISTAPSMNTTVNQGQSCMRGRFGIVDLVRHPDRLQKPMVKKEGRWIETSWENAVCFVAEKFSKYNKEKFACIVSPQNTNEDIFSFKKFTHEVMKSNNIAVSSIFGYNEFTNTIQEMQEAYVPTVTIDDIDKAGLIVVWGGDISVSHPIVSLRIIQAQNSGAKLIVVDFRKTKLAEKADFFVQLRPGSDRILIAGLLKIMMEGNVFSEKGSDKIKRIIKRIDFSSVRKQTGISDKDMKNFISLLIENEHVQFIYGPDVALQTEVKDTISAISNLALSVKDGKVLSVVGESNLMGCLEIGCVEHNMAEIVQNIEAGKIQCLYAAGELPELECLNKLEFLVVQSVFPPKWMNLADVVLPASHLSERDGTITNFEGRVQRAHRVIKPQSNTKPDWWISSKISEKINGSDFGYKNASDVFKEIVSSLPKFKGLTYRKLGKRGKHILSVKGKNVYSHFVPFSINMANRVSVKGYPFSLIFSWNLLDYRNGTFTDNIPGMDRALNQEKVEINPEDAEKVGVQNGDKVCIKSPDGLLIYRIVEITSKVKKKTLFTWFGRNDLYEKLLKENLCSVKIEKGDHE